MGCENTVPTDTNLHFVNIFFFFFSFFYYESKMVEKSIGDETKSKSNLHLVNISYSTDLNDECLSLYWDRWLRRQSLVSWHIRAQLGLQLRSRGHGWDCWSHFLRRRIKDAINVSISSHCLEKKNEIIKISKDFVHEKIMTRTHCRSKNSISE